MKKIFTLAFIALTLLATACGKNNNDNPSTPQNDAKKALIGTWKIESVTVNETIQVLSDCDKGNIIRIVTKNETSDKNFSISGNKLILSHTEETNGEKRNFVITYIKQ